MNSDVAVHLTGLVEAVFEMFTSIIRLGYPFVLALYRRVAVLVVQGPLTYLLRRSLHLQIGL